MKMETTTFLILTCLMVCVNCARKTKMEQKFDALDNLFQGKMFLVSEKLETGRLEREYLMEKLNETMTYLEAQCKAKGSNLVESSTKARGATSQGDVDVFTDKLEDFFQKVKQNNIETDELSETFLSIKQGVHQEKLARKAVTEQFLEMQNNQNEMQKNQSEIQENLNELQKNQNEMQKQQNEMQKNQSEIQKNLNELQKNQNEIHENLNELQENQNETKQSLDRMKKNLNEMQEIQNKMQTKQNEMDTNMNTVISNQNQILNKMADLIQDAKENNAPKLYCKNQLGLDTCLEKLFTDQPQMKNFMAVIQPVRLVGGSSKYEGRVEIYHGARRGTVCDDGWDNNDARVVCRMLGYTGGTALLGKEFANSHSFGAGTGEILLESLRCTGSEASLFDCGHDGIGIHNCGHHEDAGVRCDP